MKKILLLQAMNVEELADEDESYDTVLNELNVE